MTAGRISIADYAKQQGIELLPWQRQYAEAYDRGETPVMQLGKQIGRHTLQRLIRERDELGRDGTG